MPIPQSEPAIGRGLLREDVYGRLRDAIVGGVLAPGEQLRDGELAAWLGVSRTPVLRRAERLRFSTLGGRASVARHDELIRLCAAGDADAAAAVAFDTWHSLPTTEE
ncbi:GntR family transcriptional regulator [Jiangella anatolica]|uniref:HTH gntR-type domain-containing protein n=1 Tax=Jiangella anatolica TaxID=2670374 RepID=A0A2W2BVF2_9ACTN|nr:GntR family transcriptional regulator [Jiangella anatolica]PZF80139.1 hypothetical protein C1I92_27540 [Jiangella anatolica]